MFGDGGRDTPPVLSDPSVEPDTGRGEDERPSSKDGNEMLPVRLFNTFAKEDVRRKVFVTPYEIALPIVSLRVMPGRLLTGDNGVCWFLSEESDGARV